LPVLRLKFLRIYIFGILVLLSHTQVVAAFFIVVVFFHFVEKKCPINISKGFFWKKTLNLLDFEIKKKKNQISTLGSSRLPQYRRILIKIYCEICYVPNCGWVLLLMIVTLATLKNWKKLKITGWLNTCNAHYNLCTTWS
jgi:hypothetical protein